VKITVHEGVVSFMVCLEPTCKGEGSWFTDDGDREWFVYEGDGDGAWCCPECGEPGTRYPY
jgi:hypothetical protein